MSFMDFFGRKAVLRQILSWLEDSFRNNKVGKRFVGSVVVMFGVSGNQNARFSYKRANIELYHSSGGKHLMLKVSQDSHLGFNIKVKHLVVKHLSMEVIVSGEGCEAILIF